MDKRLVRQLGLLHAARVVGGGIVYPEPGGSARLNDIRDLTDTGLIAALTDGEPNPAVRAEVQVPEIEAEVNGTRRSRLVQLRRIGTLMLAIRERGIAGVPWPNWYEHVRGYNRKAVAYHMDMMVLVAVGAVQLPQKG